jgi:hypothetical protein
MLYKEIKERFELSPYLLILDNQKHRHALTKLRLSSHKLNIEKGRHRNISREDRKCLMCSRNDLKDEYHFVLVCDAYKSLRKNIYQKYIQKDRVCLN